VFLGGKLSHITASRMKLQPTLASQPRDKRLIPVGLRRAKLVVEMNDGENDAKFVTQLKQQPKQRNRINPARNRNPNPVSGPQQFLSPDMPQYALRQ
jgi:hypothetical protein